MDAQGRIGSQDHLLLKRGLRKKGKRNDLFNGYEHISLYSKKQKENLVCTQERRKLEGVENGCSRKQMFTGAPHPPQEGFKEEGKSPETGRLETYVGAYLICTDKKQKENLFLSDTKSNCWQRSLHRLKEHVLRILHQAGHRQRERRLCKIMQKCLVDALIKDIACTLVVRLAFSMLFTFPCIASGHTRHSCFRQ
jgi:hypothetical protein